MVGDSPGQLHDISASSGNKTAAHRQVVKYWRWYPSSASAGGKGVADRKVVKYWR